MRTVLRNAIWWFWRLVYAPIPGSWHFAFGTRRETIAVWIAGQMYYWGEAAADRLPEGVEPF